MHRFIVLVSIRKGMGPEWFEKEFEVSLEDIDIPITEQELEEWAKDDVREQLQNTKDYNGDHWVILSVKKRT